MKNKNGITLIALIITIIVMLILVGVTINFALNGGIITKAKEASAQMQLEADREALLSCVIASMGLDGKVDFTDLDTEVAKIGFTGSNGSYTSKAGNSFTVDADGNILSEGESSGGSSQGGGSSSADTDLAYLKTYIGSDFEEICEPSGGTFTDPNIIMDFAQLMEDGGSMQESEGLIVYPILYKGKAYKLLIAYDENEEIYTVNNVVENASANNNTDLVYLRTFMGKKVSDISTRDQSNNLVFNDSNISFSDSYSGSPISTGEGMYLIYIDYKGNDYSVAVRQEEGASSFDDYTLLVVLEGIFDTSTLAGDEPVATD